MDGNFKESVNNEFITCPNCGASNEKGCNSCRCCDLEIVSNDNQVNFQQNCNQLIEAQSNQQNVNNDQDVQQNTSGVENKKTKPSPLFILLGIATLILTAFVPIILPITAILCIASFFNKKTISFGITILIVLGMFAAILPVLALILFGACMKGLGAF